MKRKFKKGILGGLIFVLVFFAASLIIMFLWNWLIPSIVGWGAIGFWQSMGLLLLCKLLFGNIRHPMPFGRKFKHGHHLHLTPEERIMMREKVKDMSAEERKEYIQKYMFGRGSEQSTQERNE